MSPETKEKLGYGLIIFTALLAFSGILSQDPIAQEASYHLFSDTREIWLIPNFWNVASNLPFVIIGFLGLYKLKISGELNFIGEMYIAYLLLFLGIFLVGFGSAYYHLTPDKQTLVWDRLPMTIAFMSLFSIIIGEFISARAGRGLLLPLILTGIFSVIYWQLTESSGEGDLRLYILVQFYPILVIPIILTCFRSTCTHVQAYWWLLLSYVVAKLFEYFDGEIYNALGFISGHSLKHVVAALGMYVVLALFQKRRCHGHGTV